jgi:hypothetical protein
MKQAIATLIALAGLAGPAQALAAPILAAPLPGARFAQAGTSTTSTTSTLTTPASGGGSTSGRLTLNDVSDHRALSAYAAYLNALIALEPDGQLNDSNLIATVSQPGTGGCKGALSLLAQPSNQVDGKVQHTLSVLGQEIGDDLTISFDTPAASALGRFAATLRSLRWTRFSGAEPAIRHYINAQSQVLAMTPSDLCQHATAAELQPEQVPDGTRTFLAAYSAASQRANNALTDLMTVMQTYEMPGERALVARIATLAEQLTTQTRADLLQSASALTAVLESS